MGGAGGRASSGDQRHPAIEQRQAEERSSALSRCEAVRPAHAGCRTIAVVGKQPSTQSGAHPIHPRTLARLVGSSNAKSPTRSWLSASSRLNTPSTHLNIAAAPAPSCGTGNTRQGERGRLANGGGGGGGGGAAAVATTEGSLATSSILASTAPSPASNQAPPCRLARGLPAACNRSSPVATGTAG